MFYCIKVGFYGEGITLICFHDLTRGVNLGIQMQSHEI